MVVTGPSGKLILRTKASDRILPVLRDDTPR